MKNILSCLILSILFFGSCSSSKESLNKKEIESGPTIISVSAEGNLESFEPIEKCVDIAEVKSINTPADILPASKICVDEEKYEAAIQLNFLARLYAFYDMKRVSDGTAHQAIFMLEEQIYSSLNEEQFKHLQNASEPFQKPDSEESKKLCSNINMLGPPKYHPTYMIQHGLGAFTNQEGNGLVKEFDSTTAWSEVLAEMECS